MNNEFLALRKRSGLTQREMADKLSKSVRQIQRWEAGDKVPAAILEYVKIVFPKVQS